MYDLKLGRCKKTISAALVTLLLMAPATARAGGFGGGGGGGWMDWVNFGFNVAQTVGQTRSRNQWEPYWHGGQRVQNLSHRQPYQPAKRRRQTTPTQFTGDPLKDFGKELKLFDPETNRQDAETQNNVVKEVIKEKLPEVERVAEIYDTATNPYKAATTIMKKINEYRQTPEGKKTEHDLWNRLTSVPPDVAKQRDRAEKIAEAKRIAAELAENHRRQQERQKERARIESQLGSLDTNIDALQSQLRMYESNRRWLGRSPSLKQEIQEAQTRERLQKLEQQKRTYEDQLRNQ
jgi:hypothetical protein